MAPKKSVRWSDGGGEVKKPAANRGVVTRSSSTRRRLSESLATAHSDELPKSKKAKPNSSPKGKGKGINEAGKIDSVSAADHLKSEGAPAEKPKTIVIEHCKQCNSFKTRAVQVKNGLEKGLLGITVLVNPEKPRRGCFEIREEGGEKFISLLDMKRPFKPMKALDMDKVISDIIAQIG